ncbi:MAG: enoyl-CoA hydratase [Gammaproteobacteria bacterium]|jgi:enoyl-CoA hydratase/carnithine racemase|nr:MAG: enoyl-CoA hydratase [Pseudomonadota bacterium]MBC6945553.1 enoyl-CoA hydratase [Gammaproteobacteria bacterium]MCE7895917.1 enoyl-CoA hydratase [Gammaproteobacteria bacterium PRO8]MDL1880631.1 enoyl-CoA hydratase [Gammaproteobacteria bacterium PRO2]MCL4777127.1 enoyl-CoA hydratase/isomerase family protein [Gammaproteobacteria bacterium]
MSAVTTQLDQYVLQIRIDRPEKKNALTMDMYEVMSAALEQAEADSSVRAVVFSGAGGNFCSGNDVAAFPAAGSQPQGPNPVMRFVEALVNASVPIVAAVEGVAAGIGATMLLHLDGVVASAGSRIVFPFLNLALVPEAGSSLLLVRLLGYTRAAELMLRAATIDGTEAHRLGIVSRLAEPGAVGQVALDLAAEFASKPPQAMRRAKRLMKGDTAELMQRIREEERGVFLGLGSAEGAEALRAFREKRRPNFS